MSIPDDQIGLLQTAASALHNWQIVAESAGVTIAQVVMEFPPPANRVQFTWIPAQRDSEGNEIAASRFDVATLT